MLKIDNFVQRDLKGFQILIMYEVYRTNEDGIQVKSLGFFRNYDLAKVFAATQQDSSFHQIRSVRVLTDNEVAFLIDTATTVNLVDEKAETERLREAALAKLSLEERKILELPS